jgi:hypothetical protein
LARHSEANQLVGSFRSEAEEWADRQKSLPLLLPLHFCLSFRREAEESAFAFVFVFAFRRERRALALRKSRRESSAPLCRRQERSPQGEATKSLPLLLPLPVLPPQKPCQAP